MDRRIRRSLSKAESSYLRYLKPGALAKLRDSRINAKTHRIDSKGQISVYRAPPSPSPLSSPVRSPTAVQTQIDGLPCFSGRICGGPRCPQRKKLVAAKSVYFLSSNPSSPVSDLPDPIIDVFGADILVAH